MRVFTAPWVAAMRGWSQRIAGIAERPLTGVALFVAGNRLLRMGVMAAPEVAGTPLLVILVSAAAVVMSAATLPWLTPRASARPS